MSAKQPLWTRIVPVLAIVSIVAGIVTIVVATPQSASFGWFAYSPLSSTAFSPSGVVVLTWVAIVGAIAICAGIALLALWAGFSLGSSRSRRELPPTPEAEFPSP